MKVEVRVTRTEVWVLETDSIPLMEDLVSGSDYHRHNDEKWIKFCKEHNFHPIKDAYSKFYELYLQLCAEDLI